jgi:hypothetical protein
LRMKRLKTVSVTPAIGANTVAGAMRTFPIATDDGTGIAHAGVAPAPSPASGPELSQNFRTDLFYLSPKTKPPPGRGLYLRYKSAGIRGQGYFFAVSVLAYFRRKRSTRPAVSKSFCLPVKNG